MAQIRQNRVDAFTAWLRTIDGSPPFYQRPEFRFFADLTADERTVASQIMRDEGEQLNDEADKLEGARLYVGAGCPPFLKTAIQEALSVAGPVSVYASDEHRHAAFADRVASAAIKADWDELSGATGTGPSRHAQRLAALTLLDSAERLVRERLNGGEVA